MSSTTVSSASSNSKAVEKREQECEAKLSELPTGYQSLSVEDSLVLFLATGHWRRQIEVVETNNNAVALASSGRFVLSNEGSKQRKMVILILTCVGVLCALSLPQIYVVSIGVASFAAVGALIKLQVVGPGYIGVSKEIKLSTNIIHAKIELEGVVALCQFCRSCAIQRPPRAAHCRYCKSCVAQFDHHCLILGSCIGRDNVRYFILFILCINSLCATALSGAWQHLHQTCSMVVFIVALTSSIPMVSLLFFYISIYGFCGLTLREWRKAGEVYEGFELEERIRRLPQPFNQGFLRNMATVLGLGLEVEEQ